MDQFDVIINIHRYCGSILIERSIDEFKARSY